MFDDEHREFRVVVNGEEQYAIWPTGPELPAGWRDTGTTGGKEDCLAHIDQVWTDMRPLSLRRSAEVDQVGVAAARHAAGN